MTGQKQALDHSMNNERAARELGQPEQGASAPVVRAISIEQLRDVADNLVMLANSANDTRRRNVEQAASAARAVRRRRWLRPLYFIVASIRRSRKLKTDS